MSIDAHDPRPSGEGPDDPTIFASVWKHRAVMVASIVLFAVAAIAITSVLNHDYASKTGILLEDPQPANASGSQPRDDAMRYVADQVAILKSRAVAERASEIARRDRAAEPGLDARGLSRKLSVSSSESSNYVTVTVRADDPRVSQGAANAAVKAYRELTRAKIKADVAATRRRIDVAIRAAETAADETTGTTASAQRQHEAALELLDTLRGRLSDLEANSRLAGDGVALVVAAARGTKQGVSLPVALLVAIVLGGLAGAGVAYVIESRSPSLTTAAAARHVIDAPALAEIPHFGRDGIRSLLPTVESPRTAAADAFRFLAFELGLRHDSAAFANVPAERSNAGAERAGGGHVVAFVAPSQDAGATTIVANTALAAAQEGRKVLAVDCDVAGNGLTHLLSGDNWGGGGGFLDVLAGAGVDRVVRAPTALAQAPESLRLLPPGTPPPDLMTLFQAERVVRALQGIARPYELVLIDVPPLIDAAYSASLLRAAAAVVVVVPYGVSALDLARLRERLDLINIDPIGCVFNRGARRPSLTRRALGWFARVNARLPLVPHRVTRAASPTRVQ